MLAKAASAAHPAKTQPKIIHLFNIASQYKVKMD
jgi:hypothetical protein